MLVTGIKSKPVYAPLRADPRGRYHLMLGLGLGEVALLRVLREMQQAALEGLARTRVLLIPAPAVGDASTAEAWREIEALPLQEVRVFSDVAALLGEFKSLLADSAHGHAALRGGAGKLHRARDENRARVQLEQG